MKNNYLIAGVLMACLTAGGVAQAAEDCIIEGDHIKVTARIWVEPQGETKQWMAQLDKPLCVMGVNPTNQTTYKISNTVMLVKLSSQNASIQQNLDTLGVDRAELDGIMQADHEGEDRTKCSLSVSAVTEAKAGHLVSELVHRGDAKLPWSLHAKTVLQNMLSNRQAIDSIGKNAIEFVHPLNNYQGVTDWSVTDKGANLALTMRVAWKGKILDKVYYTDIEWLSSSAGHVSATIVKDDGKIPVTDGKLQKMDNYFRDQIWPSLRNNLK